MWIGATIARINDVDITSLEEAADALLRDQTGEQTVLVLKKCASPLPLSDTHAVRARGRPSVMMRQVYKTVVVRKVEGMLPFDTGDTEEGVVVTSSTCDTVAVGCKILGVMGTNVMSSQHFLALATKRKFTMDVVSLVSTTGP